jgi:hypothetical protein
MAKEIPGRNGGRLKLQESGTPSHNPAGRGKGVLNAKTVIRRWLEAQETAKNPVSGGMEKMTQLDIITLKQLEKARKGDTASFNALLDRTEGKPHQSTDLTSNGLSINQPITRIEVVHSEKKNET